MIRLEQLGKRYDVPDDGGGMDVLRNISISIEDGDALAITGPSGSGKSTLLNIVGGLDRPTSGKVLFNGRDLAGMSDADISSVRNKEIGFVFQSHHLLPQCSVLENVLIPTLPGGGSAGRRGEAASRAVQLLDRVGLGARVDHRPGMLSGGECQRAAVVRAMINRPSLLLADEPTGSLDQASAEQLGALLLELNATDGVTLVVVTHSSKLAGRMKRAYSLQNGELAPIPLPI
ncbi:MAG: hypothetical protein C0404_02850 [Verrucomicrobia bacterium]|nr:hypothetical protein [Verrucomicrobiota bacterium]